MLLVAGSEGQLKVKPSERYTELLARALGLGSGPREVNAVAEVVRRMQFVLTPEIAMKLLLINERKVRICTGFPCQPFTTIACF
jgi:hypothetical protein